MSRPKKIIKLPSFQSCTGCGVCAFVCPKNAIHLEKDPFGNERPHINKKNCCACGICLTHCQVLNQDEIRFYQPNNCFLFRGDSRLSKGCSSGGASVAISDSLFGDNWVVYGCSFKNGKAVHSRATTLQETLSFKGSKYVESDIESVYKAIQTDIKKGCNILFFGTPCQVAALEMVFPQKNIIFVSFPCGGTPSPIFLSKEIESHVSDLDGVSVVFRKGHEYCFSIEKNGVTLFNESRNANDYLFLFDKKYSIRSCCTKCLYSRNDRIGDFTIGDYWGQELTDGPYSILIANSQKAMALVPKISEFGSLMKRDFKMVSENNDRLFPLHYGRRLAIKRRLFHIVYLFFGYKSSVRVLKWLSHWR